MSAKTEAKEITESDFDDLFLAETASFEVKFPNGKPMLWQGKPVIVHLYGPGSVEHEKAQDKMNREVNNRVMSRLAAREEGGTAKEEGNNKDIQVQFLIDVTERFENLPFPGGVPAIYKDRRFAYINSFVDRKLGDLGNFLPAGKKD